ncbi:MAG TPA: DUF2062 domain-containing protein [Gammaproteobacteria bacterium]|nr:DUF2062 domain-containing protein [Gammaproteobacteria bacterium]
MSLRENRLTRLITGLLSQGITPHKVALTLALGVVLGVNPLIGTSTTLCVVAALWLGLNLPLIQLINYLAYPLQILLLIPFVQAGQWLFREPPLPFSATDIKTMLAAGLWKAIQTLWSYALHGMVAWLFLGALMGLAIYGCSLPILKRLARQR